MDVRSKDGTSIAYQRTGAGPAVILVTGGLDDGSENAPLAKALEKRFTVYNYARRGRGQSGDTLPYAVAREVEDIEALIAVAGGSAHLYGVSSGGALAFEAALAGLAIDRIAVYEVPFDLCEDTPRQQRQYVEKLKTLLASGRRGDALELFMRVAGSSEEQIAGAKQSSLWPGLELLAPTLAYDAACLGDRRPDPTRLAKVEQKTLVATGGGFEPFERGADAIAEAIPRATRITLEGQGHVVDAAVLGPVLESFYLD